MKIYQRAILGLAISIMLLDALWTTAVYASSPETETESISQEEQKLTPEEVKAWMDENQIEYTISSEYVNSYRPTRAELTALFLNDEFNPKTQHFHLGMENIFPNHCQISLWQMVTDGNATPVTLVAMHFWNWAGKRLPAFETEAFTTLIIAVNTSRHSIRRH